MNAALTTAGRLNAQCFCVTLDRTAMVSWLQRHAGHEDLWRALPDSHPHLFAANPAFVDRTVLAEMEQAVAALERVIHLPAYQAFALQDAPPIARDHFGPAGVLMGYDFHITGQGPRLIEINTNAGGAFLNAALRKAQIACCAEVADAFALPSGPDFANQIAAMFQSEWASQGRTRPLTTIAILDDDPAGQYLYPEFVLAKALLEEQGLVALIGDPANLTYDGETLSLDGTAIDLVYNRITDFMLDEPRHLALRRAYEDGAVVVTPSPRHHALFANKRNLVVLSDAAKLQALGASSADIASLAVVPPASLVSATNADALWAGRKDLFFKPLGGHGGKAVYRGDKLTRGTFEAILQGGYVAQSLVVPGQRMVQIGGQTEPRKMDVRLYTYRGRTLIAAARLYQGQTTNFRTPGGGFAPVFAV